MKTLVMVVLAATLLAASPPPIPSPVPTPQLTPEQAQLQQATSAYRQLQSAFQIFQDSVYEPWCLPHKGVAGIALIGQPDKNGLRPAWPAVVSCRDGHVVIVKSPLEKAI